MGDSTMSEALDKVTGIRHLPLFPLPLVLLPNEVLPLHIFEPRYKKLILDAQSERNLFGVVLLNNSEGVAADRPETGTVGCVAEIREVHSMPDGRSNILTLGVIRFRVIDYVDGGDPYLVGDVDFFEDEPEDVGALASLAEEVFALFERVAKAAFKISGSRGQFPEIPRSDPERLSFLITAAFNLENEMKYELLETTSTTGRLEKLREILLKTVTAMEESAEIHKVAQANGHVKKDLDL